ncbi:MULTISPECIES: GntR family transcriptional regulator [Rhodanobacteraceae]|jgi:DNA-binding GntR family transcriptional regulator|uniref:GntR family transcriptional regulator n=1 Tax=Rhodanobacteraceae TaxID=1775411 RepID=UPI00088FDB86|nr:MULTISPECIES: GntR family transcriptional regulator [Rhodanobacteraceae]SDG87945.1 DNA-binding transcriptional regulator, GntR family [Dyella sp. 333MFSha]SKB77754.1 DNA-binding transcriptional regulator, GntR family [Luteibacter sp. 22Crub2.1]
MSVDPKALPTLTEVTRSTLVDQVYRQLRDALMSGRFEPGQPLTIRGLAEALGSSPMPVREALHRLHAERAFEVTQTARIRVPVMTVARLREIRDARVALEGLLAEKAAALIDKNDLAEIRAIYKQMQAAVTSVNVPDYLWANFAFHRRIYAVARTELVIAAVETFWLHMGPCFGLVAPDKAHLRRSMEAHRRIVEALVDRDGPAARAAVADDIMQAADSLTHLLADSSGRAPTQKKKGTKA